MLEPKERYYTVKEAAKLLKVSPGRVHQLICWGKLPSIKIGPLRLILEKPLKEFAAKERKVGRPKSRF